jgi:hypothetical protein
MGAPGMLVTLFPRENLTSVPPFPTLFRMPDVPRPLTIVEKLIEDVQTSTIGWRMYQGSIFLRVDSVESAKTALLNVIKKSFYPDRSDAENGIEILPETKAKWSPNPPTQATHLLIPHFTIFM